MSIFRILCLKPQKKEVYLQAEKESGDGRIRVGRMPMRSPYACIYTLNLLKIK